MASRLVEEYRLFIIEGTGQKAYISCWNKGAFQGYIDFYEKGNVPEPGINSGGSYRLAYPIERLDSIMTTLREESPVYIHLFNTGPFKKCMVATTKEPVGEEEGK